VRPEAATLVAIPEECSSRHRLLVGHRQSAQPCKPLQSTGAWKSNTASNTEGKTSSVPKATKNTITTLSQTQKNKAQPTDRRCTNKQTNAQSRTGDIAQGTNVPHVGFANVPAQLATSRYKAVKWDGRLRPFLLLSCRVALSPFVGRWGQIKWGSEDDSWRSPARWEHWAATGYLNVRPRPLTANRCNATDG
jgi:hypothetical protein